MARTARSWRRRRTGSRPARWSSTPRFSSPHRRSMPRRFAPLRRRWATCTTRTASVHSPSTSSGSAGKLETGEVACAECHSRVMPDGTVINGAQGNRPVRADCISRTGRRAAEARRQGKGAGRRATRAAHELRGSMAAAGSERPTRTVLGRGDRGGPSTRFPPVPSPVRGRVRFHRRSCRI